ncbi:MAG: zf-HC2 domain-containing protein [Phycisphaerales bacterium]|nr:zf-HC2 domain-containing protein [Phycisphaerales bacterium]
MAICRHVTGLLSRAQDEPLPWRSRVLVIVHLLYCRPCRRFQAQLRLLARAVRKMGENVSAEPALPADVRERVRAALRAGEG